MTSIVRDTRIAEGLTQAQLARRLGISQPSVARMESAGDAITLATLRRALNAMGRGLVVQSVQQKSSVDETLLPGQLRLTPAERLESMTRGYANVMGLREAFQRARDAA